MEEKLIPKQELPLGMILIDRMNHEIFRVLRKQIGVKAEIKLTVEEFALIYILSRRQDKVIQKNLAEAMGKDKSTILRLVNSLENKKLIGRMECPDDRRKSYLILTKRGEKVLDQYLEIETGLIEKLKYGLSNSEEDILYKMICRIKTNAETL
ncbi:MAG: MarR family winged helix-turn-helix transcriptional regulator [Mangrovibacterium sp.]